MATRFPPPSNLHIASRMVLQVADVRQIGDEQKSEEPQEGVDGKRREARLLFFFFWHKWLWPWVNSSPPAAKDTKEEAEVSATGQAPDKTKVTGNTRKRRRIGKRTDNGAKTQPTRRRRRVSPSCVSHSVSLSLFQSLSLYFFICLPPPVLQCRWPVCLLTKVLVCLGIAT